MFFNLISALLTSIGQRRSNNRKHLQAINNTVIFFTPCLFFFFAKVRLDHTTRTLSFGSDLNYCTREDAPLGPQLQSMPSEQIRNQLTAMSSALAKALAVIKPPHLLVSNPKSSENIDECWHSPKCVVWCLPVALMQPFISFGLSDLLLIPVICFLCNCYWCPLSSEQILSPWGVNIDKCSIALIHVLMTRYPSASVA